MQMFFFSYFSLFKYKTQSMNGDKYRFFLEFSLRQIGNAE